MPLQFSMLESAGHVSTSMGLKVASPSGNFVTSWYKRSSLLRVAKIVAVNEVCLLNPVDVHAKSLDT